MENVRSQPRFFVKFIFFFSINFFANWFLREKLDMPIRIGEVSLIAISSFILTRCFFSVIVSPTHFFIALKERVVRLFGLIAILFVKMYGAVMAITYRFWSVAIRILLIIIYWASPIDIIADFLLGVGQLDDLAITLLGGWWVFRDLRKHVSERTKNTINSINEKTKIKTPFP